MSLGCDRNAVRSAMEKLEFASVVKHERDENRVNIVQPLTARDEPLADVAKVGLLVPMQVEHDDLTESKGVLDPARECGSGLVGPTREAPKAGSCGAVKQEMKEDILKVNLSNDIPPPLAPSIDPNILFSQSVHNEVVPDRDRPSQPAIATSGPYACEVCHKVISRKDHFKRHMSTQHGASTVLFPCRICSKTFPRKDSLKRHLITHGATLANSCHRLDLAVGQVSVPHVQNANAFHCDRCNDIYSRKEDLDNHVLSHALPMAVESKLGRPRIKLEDFPIDCKFGLADIGSHSEIRLLQCDVCMKQFKRMYDLEKHRSTHGESCKNLFACDVGQCRRRFELKKSMLKHRATHVNSYKKVERRYDCSCDVCGEQFSRTSKLRVHMLVHASGSPEFFCEFPSCDERYKHKSHLEDHVMSKHSSGKDKPFSCSEKSCGKQFLYEFLLRNHIMARHAGINLRAFVCDVAKCKKSYSQYKHLVQHKLSHATRKLHQCDDCGKEFLQRYHFNRHKRTHVGTSKLLKCDHCEVVFTSKRHIQDHMKSHADELLKPRDIYRSGNVMDQAYIAKQEVSCKSCEMPDDKLLNDKERDLDRRLQLARGDSQEEVKSRKTLSILPKSSACSEEAVMDVERAIEPYS